MVTVIEPLSEDGHYIRQLAEVRLFPRANVIFRVPLGTMDKEIVLNRLVNLT